MLAHLVKVPSQDVLLFVFWKWQTFCTQMCVLHVPLNVYTKKCEDLLNGDFIICGISAL